jgi:C-terminal duplication domain of Friend of PRMT1
LAQRIEAVPIMYQFFLKAGSADPSSVAAPKVRAGSSARGRRGRGRAGPSGAGRRPKKTVEELDEEMTDYFGTGEPVVAQPTV